MSELSIKYQGLEPYIAKEIAFYEDKYFCYDEPVPFCGLLLYPVTLRNYNEFFSVIDCLTLDKNKTPEGIKYNHLDYMLLQTVQKEDGVIWSYKFSRLIELIFHIQNGIKCKDCGNVISYESYFKKIEENKDQKDFKLVCNKCSGQNLYELIKFESVNQTTKKKMIIDQHEITSKDYEKLRKIVLFQNLPDYRDDSKVDARLKEDYEEKMRLQSKNQGKATLEKKIIAVATKTSYKIAELYDMTIRKFSMLLYTLDDVMNYEARKLGMMTGMVSFKEEQEHWIYKKEKDMYGDSYVSPEEIKDELGKT